MSSPGSSVVVIASSSARCSMRSSSRSPVWAIRAGTYLYNSLADLDAGQPALYARVLDGNDQRAGTTSGALYLADAWRVTPSLQIVYGGRIEGTRLAGVPAANDSVANAFARRTDVWPNQLRVAPRIGFHVPAWQCRRDSCRHREGRSRCVPRDRSHGVDRCGRQRHRSRRRAAPGGLHRCGRASTGLVSLRRRHRRCSDGMHRSDPSHHRGTADRVVVRRGIRRA